jgi:protein-disulfide isomerase
MTLKRFAQALGFVSVLGSMFLTTTGTAGNSNGASQPPAVPTPPAPPLSEAQKQQIQTVVRDYLLKNPQVLLEVSQKLQQQQQDAMRKMEQHAQKVIPTLAKELLNAPTSPMAGNPQGDITVVEFYDPQCPHCKEMGPLMMDLLKKDPNVRVVYKLFPVFGPDSMYAGKAAIAAARQGKFMAFNEALLGSSDPLTQQKVLELAKQAGLNVSQLQKDMEDPKVEAELQSNIKMAGTLQLMGTPAFVVASTTNTANGQRTPFLIPGTTTPEVLQGVIEQVRRGPQNG